VRRISGTFFDALFDLHKFVAYEQRDPFMLKQQQALGLTYVECVVMCVLGESIGESYRKEVLGLGLGLGLGLSDCLSLYYAVPLSHHTLCGGSLARVWLGVVLFYGGLNALLFFLSSFLHSSLLSL
jgi:hypothetical protein